LKKARLLRFPALFIAVTVAYILVSPIILPITAQTTTVSYPNDPLLSEQWGWLKINANAAWLTGHEGNNVIVAIFDTGINLNHPDLKDTQIIYAWNYVDNNSNVTDEDGHGTLVAGVVAAITNNQIGIAGIVSKAKLAIFKVLEESGGTWMDLAGAVRKAREIGADVYTMSLGGTIGGRASSLLERELSLAYNAGGVIVAAAGNDNTDTPSYPAAYDEVIGVGAIGENETRASWSNYGVNVELMAPGVSVLSSFLDVRYVYASGTSIAAPHVAGVAALLLEQNPSLTPSQVRERLHSTAVNLGDSYYYGYGLVDAQAALGVEIPAPVEPSPEPPEPQEPEEPEVPPPIEEEPVVEPPQVQPPLILDIITVPEAPTVGKQVGFEGVVETHGGSITSWLWTFGDGSTSIDQNPHHTYKNPSEYDVGLQITDNNALSAYETCRIIVQDPERLDPTQPIQTEIILLTVAAIAAAIALTVVIKRT
jgi:Subtilase family/PKD domain